jgi:NAD-dependent deacetylase
VSETELERAAALLADAERIVVLTGAGVSAESGVPTFRGADGLWRNFRPEELATPEAFARDPRLVWEWYDWRRAAIGACRPNAAHLALARLALTRPGVRIVTQNVDALHTVAAREAAGALGAEQLPAAALPLELHGCILRVRCTSCGAREEHRARLDTSLQETLPRCAGCDALLRPDVVWFGEMLDGTTIDEAMRLGRAADVCLVVGTSALVYPAVGVALATAEHGGAIIEVNPEPTPISRLAAVSLRSSACEAVPAMMRA